LTLGFFRGNAPGRASRSPRALLIMRHASMSRRSTRTTLRSSAACSMSCFTGREVTSVPRASACYVADSACHRPG
jgi:hypothetical protein